MLYYTKRNYIIYGTKYARSKKVTRKRRFLYLECQCDRNGVDELEHCDKDSGKCICKRKEISNEKCDECVNGYWYFPICMGKTFILNI